MDYFNRSNNEELGGISYCSCDSTPTSSIIGDKISSISLGNGTITINKYDKAISDLSEKLENLTKKVTGDYYILTEKIKNLFKQEKSNKISEWREFDLEAATGREFETR